MLDFFTALSLVPSDIRKIRNFLATHKINNSPLENILVTPLFVSDDSLSQIRQFKEQGSRILFDSGGYYVQIGRLTYHELYYPLLQFYRKNSWGDIYTLPDYVPTSQDSPGDVQYKVEQTAKLLAAKINGHEMAQINGLGEA